MWEKEKTLVANISPYPTMFLKAFSANVVKSLDCVVKSELFMKQQTFRQIKNISMGECNTILHE